MAQVWIILLSRLARALWIEMQVDLETCHFLPSRLARALWIEILPHCKNTGPKTVEARESLVD